MFHSPKSQACKAGASDPVPRRKADAAVGADHDVVEQSDFDQPGACFKRALATPPSLILGRQQHRDFISCHPAQVVGALELFEGER